MAFIRLPKRSIIPGTLGTITPNNVLFLFLFTVENFEMLVIHTILFACNLNSMFDLSSRTKKEKSPDTKNASCSIEWELETHGEVNCQKS